MIRVCHITNVHLWDDTRIFYKECLTLANNGFAVTLIAPNAKSQIVENIQVIGVPNKSESRLYRASIFAFKILLKAYQSQAKIYHFHDPELIWIGIVLRILGKKVIFDVHENVKAQITDKKWLRFPKLAASVYSVFESLAAKLFYIIIAEDSYEEIFKGKARSITKVLNFPVAESLMKYRTTFYDKTVNGILYVGLVSESRGIFEIIKALAILKKREIAFRFHCIGPMSENLLEKLESTSDYLFVKDSVIFYGRLPIYEAYKLGEKSKVALSILHPVPNYIRSFSTKIFEYMAVGIPFIVSDFPIYEFVREEKLGFLVDPMNQLELADLLEGVLLNKFELKEQIEKGVNAVKLKYSWESQSKNLIGLYSNLC
jgi:glycosyltransferase involved in cell wall biosynthesis